MYKSISNFDLFQAFMKVFECFHQNRFEISLENHIAEPFNLNDNSRKMFSCPTVWIGVKKSCNGHSSHYCKLPSKKSRKGKFFYGIGHLLRIYVVDHRNGKSNKLWRPKEILGHLKKERTLVRLCIACI